jgi:hypothetical protein
MVRLNHPALGRGTPPATGSLEMGLVPYEKINRTTPSFVVTHAPVGATLSVNSGATDQLVVEWDRIGWVNVALYPEGWSHTGQARRVELPPQTLDLLIKTLKRARRAAYANGQRYMGYKDDDEGLLSKVSEEMDDNLDDGEAPEDASWWEPVPFGRKVLIPESIQEYMEDVPQTIQFGDPWVYDQDGQIRNRLFLLFGIETDGDNPPLPTEVQTTLMVKHRLTHEQAANMLYPPVVHEEGATVRSRKDVVGGL